MTTRIKHIGQPRITTLTLKLKILGESLSIYKQIKKSKEPEGEIIESWMINWG
ncbi:hypothetical protein [Shewanella sp. YLB-07]|uniref:hypothetical protein n=1 Tax=Shewanella sp. YLB-07 TaxID=2601268 RepID=UPI001D153FC0|nr:hypothetical protein [Shewanella sp. YLB-07]